MGSCGVESVWNMSCGYKVRDDICLSSYLYNYCGMVYMVVVEERLVTLGVWNRGWS